MSLPQSKKSRQTFHNRTAKAIRSMMLTVYVGSPQIAGKRLTFAELTGKTASERF